MANPAERRGLPTFATNPVDRVLDRVEFEELAVEAAVGEHNSTARPPRWHSSLSLWIDHAARTYLRAAAQLSEVDGQRLLPVRHQWAVQHPVRPPQDQDVREIRAIGRGYESEDGELREIRLLRTYSVDPEHRPFSPPDLAEIAATAFVLADGRTLIGPWQVPFVVSRTAPAVRRVRIVEVGLYDGTHHVVLDEPTATVRDLYSQHARGPLSESLDGSDLLPGYDCVRCHLRSTCPALPQHAGLLGVHDPTAPARTWSITTGRYYRNCPCQAHFRELRLPYPAHREYGVEARRGNAVHQWLEDQHKRPSRRSCRPAEVPPGSSWWSEWTLFGDDARRGDQMIGDHADECPLATMTSSDTIMTEHPIVVYDPEANVIVHAKIDTVYTERGRTVVRETKTTGRVHEGDLLRRYPQIALHLVLAAGGHFGDIVRVELERLTPAGALVTRFNPRDDWLVAEAREVVHDLAAPWHADLSMLPEPGRACDTCEVSMWCPENRKKND
ncbi:PD-(D/E)XK nuclease family protein [Saccharomonospora sp. NPDC046836]|uniref:PD-(D/E)XK nuclease family protein n=1 Tax=Saccharomonospora sp. NPDC046836 TaxID=3156921 RepID=UPI0033EB183F